MFVGFKRGSSLFMYIYLVVYVGYCRGNLCGVYYYIVLVVCRMVIRNRCFVVLVGVYLWLVGLVYYVIY